MPKIEQMADKVFAAIRGHIAKALLATNERIGALEERIRSIPSVKDGIDGKDGVDGKDGASGLDGKNGVDGKDGAPGVNGQDGRDGIDGVSGKDGAPGVNGKDGAPGIDGKDGVHGKDGIDGKDGVHGRDGIDGKDGAPGAAGKDGAPGRDGIDGKDGASGRDGVDGAKGLDGRDGRDGKDGAAGRDALSVDILASIESGRRYPAGTFVRHDGGTLYAVRDTDVAAEGMSLSEAGWRVVWNGIADFSFDTVSEREHVLRAVLTDGRVIEKKIVFSVPLFHDVWRAGEAYAVGDMVQRDGSVWYCKVDGAKSAPGPANGSGEWRLAVKRGAEGRPGRDGKDGVRGADGKPGKDLTQLGFDGGKH